MAPEGFKRKLTAILSADVVGYSRLMGEDEEATIRTLTTYRNAIAKLVQQFRGRIVDSPGDNILSEFTSVVDAVNCAVEIQRELAERNADLPYNRKMEFRIGVNVGDVVQKEERIYGDGVNIAARVESMSQAGGICISGEAYDQVSNKLGLKYENLGEHQVKNISTPIRVYRVLSIPGAAAHRVVQTKKILRKKWLWAGASTTFILLIIVVGLYWKYFYLPTPTNIDPENKMTFNLPKGPSIAVLPFDNMTGDPEQEFFCDGITETIISALSQTPKLFVIARNSTFAYKGKQINAQQIGHELNAAYVIEGSIQKSDERIRVTVQLIDTKSGNHLWAEQYNRKLKDIFKLQDEITLKIMKTMQIKLAGGEQFRSRLKGIGDLQLALKLFRALDYFFRGNIEGTNLARQEIIEIIELDPDISSVHALLAATYLQDLQFGTCKSNIICFGQATEATRKAISLDETNSDAHLIAGWLFVMQKDYKNGIASLKRSISLNPNNADAYAFLGYALAVSDQPSEGIKYIEKAFLLNPSPPSFYLVNLGICYRMLEQYGDAITAFKKSIQIQPDNIVAHIGLIFAYSLSGQEDKAYKIGLEVLKLNPSFSVEKYVNASPFSRSEDKYVLFAKALRKAGLPD
jgi:adenylate cyclase